MGLRTGERWKLRRIEEGLREDAPGLDALLASGLPLRRPVPRRSALRTPAAWVLAGYLAPLALLLAGLVPHVTGLVVAGAVTCPLIPVIAWLLIRRHFIRGWPGQSREP